MKLSTTATYGLRVCFLLALADGKTMSLSTLVRQADLSEKYLEQILGKLRKGGIVRTKRGAGGGYALARPAASIPVGEILRALNSDFAFAECASGKCEDMYCPNRKLIRKIYDAVDNIVGNTTLEDMVHDYTCVR